MFDRLTFVLSLIIQAQIHDLCKIYTKFSKTVHYLSTPYWWRWVSTIPDLVRWDLGFLYVFRTHLIEFCPWPVKLNISFICKT
ncbi:uncharacterized protein EDB93DRAFT_332468 [Suillus bovinus]|uniref:uncharacterized protein n=1 Tax=Suillus bovinus TaxID=48563 RepID=UPI001B86F121|nr:uncharacterized protein EDB93DRAFT_332468 [Suillus bovinus]KAG2150729.1 hypothetical protein EDB93DRAFT_332468 [Suillus bovinus]